MNGLANQKYRAWRIAQDVFSRASQDHLNDPAVAVGANEQQIVATILDAVDDPLVWMANQGKAGRLHPIRTQIVTSFFENLFLAVDFPRRHCEHSKGQV